MPARICFTMDNLGDAADLHRGVIQQPRQPGERPAFEQGYPALLTLYQRYGIPITHFVEGWSAEAYPEEIERVLTLGHQVGMHGWQHENWAEQSEDLLVELATRATQAITRAGGVAPIAFRAPGGARTEGTTRILSELGYSIDSSLSPTREDGGPVHQLSPSLWTAPYSWQGVDASHWLWQDTAPAQVEQYWKKALLSCAEEDSHLIFIWHPHVMGIDAERLAVGEKILQFVTQRDDMIVVSLPELVAHYQQSSRD